MESALCRKVKLFVQEKDIPANMGVLALSKVFVVITAASPVVQHANSCRQKPRQVEVGEIAASDATKNAHE